MKLKYVGEIGNTLQWQQRAQFIMCFVKKKYVFGFTFTKRKYALSLRRVPYLETQRKSLLTKTNKRSRCCVTFSTLSFEPMMSFSRWFYHTVIPDVVFHTASPVCTSFGTFSLNESAKYFKTCVFQYRIVKKSVFLCLMFNQLIVSPFTGVVMGSCEFISILTKWDIR